MEIYHSKCAYCETKINPPNDGFIHHYRPVADYPQLENEWSNLHLVCVRCNNAGNANLGEKPLLLNPEIDTPENHLYFDADGIAHSTTKRGKSTIANYSLNSSELINERRAKFELFVTLLDSTVVTFEYLNRRSYPFKNWINIG